MDIRYRGPELNVDDENAGLDLAASKQKLIRPMSWALVETDLQIAIPAGNVGLVCPRSGLALKHGVTVLNAPGIIDAGYRGLVGVVLLNMNPMPYTVEAGDRVAQLVIVPLTPQRFVRVDELDVEESARGANGFGSTGT